MKYNYRAFISYCHQDEKWGEWLHKALESYKVPKALVGKPNRDGLVPKKLFPIFRDREELSAATDLGSVITHALQESSYLIVICSPRSAKSMWVNQEIISFKRMGKEDRVLAIIVDGEPNGSDKPGMDQLECFPEALRFKLSKEGELSTIPSEPIAADARADCDGKDNAKLKLLAGLLGVNYDDLKLRDQARRMRKMQIAMVFTFILLAIFSFLSIGFYQAKNEAEANMVGLYRQNGIDSALDEHPDQALFYLNEVRRITPNDKTVQYLLADVWQQVSNLAKRFAGDESETKFIALSPDNKSLLTQSNQGHIRIWDLNENRLAFQSLGYIQHVDNKYFSSQMEKTVNFKKSIDPNNPDLLIRELILIDKQGKQIANAISWPKSFRDPDIIAIGPRGEKLFTDVGNYGDEPDVNTIWDFNNAQPVAINLQQSDSARNYRWFFSYDERHLLQIKYTGVEPYFVNVRDTATGDLTTRLEMPTRVEEIAVHKNRVIFGCANGALLTYDTGNMSLSWSDTQYHNAGISSISLTADGSSLLTTDTLGAMALWSTEKGIKIWQRDNSNNGVIATAAISPSGAKVAAAHDKIVDVYSIADNQHIMRKRWHDAKVTALTFSTDEQLLATATAKGEVKLWNLPTTNETAMKIAPLPEHEHSLNKFAKVEDGQYQISGSGVYLVANDFETVKKVSDSVENQMVTLVDNSIRATLYWGALAIEQYSEGKPAINIMEIHSSAAGLLAKPDNNNSIGFVYALTGSINSITQNGEYIPSDKWPFLAKSQLIAFTKKGRPLANKINLPQDAGAPIQLYFDDSGTRGFLCYADGRIIAFSINKAGIALINSYPGLFTQANYKILQFDEKSGQLLILEKEQIFIVDLVSGQKKGLSKIGLVTAAFNTIENVLRIITLDKQGTVEVWNSSGNITAQVKIPTLEKTGAILSLQDKVGPNVKIFDRQQILATTVNDRIYLWRLPDLLFLWRSQALNLSRGGYLAIIDINEQQSRIMLALNSSDFDFGSYDKFVSVTMPVNYPSMSVVNELLENKLKITFKGGKLVTD